MTNREWGQIGNNYLKGLFALGFQGFLIMICVGIYAVLVGEMVLADNLHSAIFPLQPIPLSSVSPCSNPAHWQNLYSTPTKGRKEVFLGVCTCTQRLIQSQNKSRFQSDKAANPLFFSGTSYGTATFLLFKDSAGTSLAAMAMIVVMLPCFLVAMYEKHGQPLEVVVKNIIQTKLTRPKVRPYQTENLYALLEKQRALEKEVSAIVKRTDKKDAGSRRKQA